VDQATLTSECQVGAKEFWQVIPSTALGLAVPAEDLVNGTRQRLCMLESPEDDWCPLCDQVLDARGHHPRTCCAGGDRTRRHNATRNKGFNFAKSAGCNPELEKSNLLLPSKPEDTTNTLRRPADVFLPTWTHGLPAALDFAITAPQRRGLRRLPWQQRANTVTQSETTKTPRHTARLLASLSCLWLLKQQVPGHPSLSWSGSS